MEREEINAPAADRRAVDAPERPEKGGAGCCEQGGASRYLVEDAPTGFITHLQRLSIHDGPGIRTTLFFKGCNFRCAWCHNPETWRRERQIERVAERCLGCGACAAVCPRGALRPEGDGLRFDRAACDACGRCAEICPAGAMNRVGRAISVDEAMRELRRDKPYFEESGGGATFSGGEPLLQPAFLRAMLVRCRAEGISTVVETNLCAPAQLLDDLVPLVDLWLCDLKLADDGLHRRWTGRSNGPTLANLRLLSERGAKPVVRTPVIPGVNDSEREIRAICALLSELKSLGGYRLLGYHTLGAGKFDLLGMENPLPAAEPLPAERLERLRRTAAGTGIHVLND